VVVTESVYDCVVNEERLIVDELQQSRFGVVKFSNRGQCNQEVHAFFEILRLH